MKAGNTPDEYYPPSQLAPDVVAAERLVALGAIAVVVVVVVLTALSFVATAVFEVGAALLVSSADCFADEAEAASTLVDEPGISLATVTPIEAVPRIATKASEAVIKRIRRNT